jgi:hypothetical protein
VKPIWFVVALFVVVLALRLAIAFSLPLQYEAYDSLRHAESIRDTGMPLYNDDLSYQGRIRMFTPVWNYFLAGVGFLMPLEIAAKLLPNLLMACSVFLAYGIVRRLTGSAGAGLFSAMAVGFLPIGFITTITTASPYSLVVFLSLLSAFFIVNLHRKHFGWYALASGILLAVSHPSSLIFIGGLIVYLLISRLEDADTRRAIEEIALVLLLFAIWFYLLIFKEAFQSRGLSLLWDVPGPVIAEWFGRITFVQAVYAIGFVSLVLGLFGAYHALFEGKKPLVLIFVGNFLILLPVLWLKLVRGPIGLLFMGITLAILAGVSGYAAYEYLGRTKVYRIRPFIVLLTVVLFGIGVVTGMGVYVNDAPTPSDYRAVEFLSSLPNNGTVLVRPQEGAFVMYVSRHPVLMDEDYLFAPQAEDRFLGVQTVFTSPFSIPVRRVLDDYGVNYVFLSAGAQRDYHVSGLPSAGDCVYLVYDEGSRIYKNGC